MFPTSSRSKQVKILQETISDEVGRRVLLDRKTSHPFKVAIIKGGFVTEIAGQPTPMYIVELVGKSKALVVIQDQEWWFDFYGQDFPNCQLPDCPKWLRDLQYWVAIPQDEGGFLADITQPLVMLSIKLLGYHPWWPY